MNVHPASVRRVAPDHAGEATVDGDQQLRRVIRTIDRAGDGERHLPLVRRELGELGPLVDRRGVVAVRSDVELGDVTTDQITIGPDAGEPDPVVAMGELLTAPFGDLEDGGDILGDTRLDRR